MKSIILLAALLFCMVAGSQVHGQEELSLEEWCIRNARWDDLGIFYVRSPGTVYVSRGDTVTIDWGESLIITGKLQNYHGHIENFGTIRVAESGELYNYGKIHIEEGGLLINYGYIAQAFVEWAHGGGDPYCFCDQGSLTNYGTFINLGDFINEAVDRRAGCYCYGNFINVGSYYSTRLYLPIAVMD